MRVRARVVAAAIVFPLLVLTAALPASATDTKEVGACPGYEATLGEARKALARGNRAGAVAILKRAREILEGCQRETPQEQTALALAQPYFSAFSKAE